MEKKILRLFLFSHSLKFNEIEKQLKTRSNKLAYHLKKLVEKNILEKKGETYSLSKTSEHLLPYLSDKQATLTVILIHIGNKKQAFLYNRTKRPFKNKLSLPGGRLQTKESINACVKRMMKDKHSINAKLKKINSVSLEHVKSKDQKVHSFILIFVTATTKDKIELTDIESNKSEIISSDYKLLKNNLNQEIKINTFNTPA